MPIRMLIIQFWLCLSAILFFCAQERVLAFYNPNTGRWLNRDPIEEVGGMNLYRFAVNNPLIYFDSSGLASYLFFDMAGGPTLDRDAGHVGIGVDFNGGIIRRDAAWGSTGPLAKFKNLKDARFGSDIVAVFQNKKLPNGQFSDDIIAKLLIGGKTSQTYTYCSRYSAEVMNNGGYDLGHGLTPNAILEVAENTTGVEIRDYNNPYIGMSVVVPPIPTINVNTPNIFTQVKNPLYIGK